MIKKFSELNEGLSERNRIDNRLREYENKLLNIVDAYAFKNNDREKFNYEKEISYLDDISDLTNTLKNILAEKEEYAKKIRKSREFNL